MGWRVAAGAAGAVVLSSSVNESYLPSELAQMHCPGCVPVGMWRGDARSAMTSLDANMSERPTVGRARTKISSVDNDLVSERLDMAPGDLSGG